MRGCNRDSPAPQCVCSTLSLFWNGMASVADAAAGDVASCLQRRLRLGLLSLRLRLSLGMRLLFFTSLLF